MRRSWAPIALLSVSLSIGCDKDDDEQPSDETKSEAASEAGASSEVATAPKLKGAIEIPKAVPADASIVIVARTPQSLFASFTKFDPMGMLAGDADTLQADLDAWFEKSLGMRFLGARTVAAFLVDKEDFGVVLVGVEGDLKSSRDGEHEGVALHDLRKSMVAARVDDLLILGTKGATTAAIDAAKGGQGKGLDEADPIAKLFAERTDGAAVAVGIETARLPKALAEDIPPNMRLQRGIAVLDGEGITLRAEGTKEQVDTVSGAIKGGLTLMVSAADAQRKDVVDKGGDALEGAFAIVAAHSAKRAQTLLEPKIDDTSLTIEIPFSMGDPASLASMAGIAAAIAIPAFTKYVRRSKTSEARVQIAKMFDAASAYFNEEHVARGSVALLAGGELAAIAAHGCPNDGKSKGEAGITPPLSVDCNEGPGGRCVPTAGGGGGPGSYDTKLWTDNEVWNGLNFQQEQGHYFHYNFIWDNDNTGFGACQFTAQAFGDLDGDGIFSTYERAGAADENGVNAAAGLYIDQEVE